MTGREFIEGTKEETGWTLEEIAVRTGYELRTVKRIDSGEVPLSEKFQKRVSEAITLSKHGKPGAKNGIAETTPCGKLKAAREAMGFSFAQLAKLTRYSAGVLEAVENGTARASEKMIEAICREIPSLSKEDLMEGSDYPSIISEDGKLGTYGAKPNIAVPPGSKARYVPLLSWAQAGALDASHLDEGYDYTSSISLDVADRRAFAVEIKGESMTPRIHPGDYAIACPSVELQSGQTVIVRKLDGDVMCKLFQSKDGGRIVVLSSWNPAFPPVEVPREEIAWIYPVKQVVQNY